MTIPVEIRRQMHLKEGDQLIADYNPQTRMLSFTKPMRPEDLAGQFGKYIKPGTKPVLNVDEYYQKHRQPRV